MRIIAGTARGHRLSAPRGRTTRPTPDRVREAIYSILALDLRGAAVLDLFAGTGALGLEALSRGARHATFVEKDRQTQRLLRCNLEAVGAGATELLPMPAERAIAWLAARGRRFDLVFLDPPYELGLLAPSLRSVIEVGLVGPSSIVVCEHSRRHEPPAAPSGWRRTAGRSFGEVAVSFYGNATAEVYP